MEGTVQAQQTSNLESIQAASQQFVVAIGARDINAMDKVWAHESYTSFIGPLSTTVVIGWDGAREAWQMRFGQFDRVTISANKPHVRISGQTASAVGMERVELLRKDGKTISFDAFVTNVFEKKRTGSGCWSRTKRRPFLNRPNSPTPDGLLSTMRAPERL